MKEGAVYTNQDNHLLDADEPLSFTSLYTEAELQLIRDVVIQAKGDRGWRTFADAVNRYWKQPDLLTPSVLRRLASFGVKPEASGALLRYLPYLAPFSEYSVDELKAIALGKSLSFETLSPFQFQRLSALFKASCQKSGFQNRPVDCARAKGAVSIPGTTIIGVYENRIGQKITAADWSDLAKSCFEVSAWTQDGLEPVLKDSIMNCASTLKRCIKGI